MKLNTGSEIMENKNIRAVFSAALAILTNYLGIAMPNCQAKKALKALSRKSATLHLYWLP